MSKKPLTYYLLKLNSMVKSHRVKFLGLWLLHKLGRRYLAVNFDPINSCNLRCKMCYFTDENYVKTLKGTFSTKDLELWAKRSLPRALKLQVGCGTEPTLYKHLDQVFELGKKYKVPHISLTTNANLLKKDKLELWVENGLEEITISLHGVYKETYEFMMGNGDYEKFHNSLAIISEVKKKYPKLVLRINYTFNEDNFEELNDFYKIYGKHDIDIIQVRALSKIGNTTYKNFSLDKIIPVYDTFIEKFKAESQKRGVTLLAASSKEKLINRSNDESLIFNYTYFYVSPTQFWREDFDWRNESFNAYSKRKGWSKQLLKNAFTSKKKLMHLQKDQNLNYSVDLN